MTQTNKRTSKRQRVANGSANQPHRTNVRGSTRSNDPDTAIAIAKDIKDTVSVATTVSANSTAIVSTVANSDERWQIALSRAIRAVVSVRFSQVSAFDTDCSFCSEATGFVVDAERGIILTNRHVVCSGPWTGVAIFHDHEEATLRPLYRDPVHDFGFLRYNPSDIKFMQVAEIPLAPHEALVGIDIRVIGNDNGEKLSILSGSLSRLDRNTPNYGELTYNDYNTFYLQAASSTSGGSSGSPVLNINGNAVALQAGGSTEAATDFFLPLQRVKRALQFVQSGILRVPRGSIHTQFLLRPFDEVRRLGLLPKTEAMVRKQPSTGIGMLVVDLVLPKSSTSGLLEEGDILVSMNGKIITHFVDLEDILDSCMETVTTKKSRDIKNKFVHVAIERGGERLEVDVPVVDLHSVTPSRFVSAGGAVFHSVSHQLAMHVGAPLEGVYVSDIGGMMNCLGRREGWIVTNIDGHPTPDLDTFIKVMKDIPDRKRIAFHFHSILDLHTKNVKVVSNDHHFASLEEWVRNDETGIWDMKKIADAVPPEPVIPTTVTFPDYPTESPEAAELFKSFVRVISRVPVVHAGNLATPSANCGIIVDKSLGLVLTTHTAAPSSLVELSIVVGDQLFLDAKPILIHPTDGFAILQYDPKEVGETDLKQVEYSELTCRQGTKVLFAALKRNGLPVSVNVSVTDVSTISIPCKSWPRFRPINHDCIAIDTHLLSNTAGGVLADDDGKVLAFNVNVTCERASNPGHLAEYVYSFPTDSVREVLSQLRNVKLPKKATALEKYMALSSAVELRGLAIEIAELSLYKAKVLGVKDKWIKEVEKSNKERRQLYIIFRTEESTPTAKFLKANDVILTIDDEIVTRSSQFILRRDCPSVVKVRVVREMEEMVIDVPTSSYSGDELTKLVMFAGAVVHKPHRSAMMQTTLLPSMIFVAHVGKGSPAEMYSFDSATFVTAVNGIQVHTVDEFIEAIRNCKTETYVRIRVVTFDLVPSVISVKLDLHYFPSVVYQRDKSKECGWALTSL